MASRKLPLLAVLAWTLPVAGCGPQRPPVHLVLAVDSSGSFHEQAMHAVDAMRLTVEDLSTSGDKLTVFRFARDCEELTSELPKDPQAFSDQMAKVFEHPSPENGTSFGRLFRRLEEAVARQAQPTVLVVFTDGANDDPDSRGADQMRAAATTLAKQGRLERLVIGGVEPGRREWLRTQLLPLGSKLQFVELEPIRLSAVLSSAGAAPKGGSR